MGRLAGFTYRQVNHKLRRLGFEFDRQARGSHEIWWNPDTTSWFSYAWYLLLLSKKIPR